MTALSTTAFSENCRQTALSVGVSQQSGDSFRRKWAA
jgi:hypothetical protein